jgi:hypothetical protein
MVKIGGFAQAATLPMIATVTVYFRYFKTDRRLNTKVYSDILLWIALVSILAAACYAIPSQLIDLGKMLTTE